MPTSNRLPPYPPKSSVNARTRQTGPVGSGLGSAGFDDLGQTGPRPVVPTKIGRFTVLRVLGEGGMGIVFAAYDDELDRRVALKLVRPSLYPGSNGPTRMLREAQALAKLSHPNVVQVYEVGQVEGQVFLALEFVRGVTLREWLAEASRPWRAVVEIFVQAGRGLAAAHAHGLIHRDFKPDNVLIDRDGRARVLDFGLARAEGTAGVDEYSEPSHTMSSSSFDASLTATGTLLGTPAYMSPEQFRRAPADARSDQFGFCVSLYEGLFGIRPFSGRTIEELAKEMCCGRMVAPTDRRGVPAWLTRAVMRGLAVDPEARWPSMDALLDHLSQRSQHARSRVALVGAIAVAAAAAASSSPRSATRRRRAVPPAPSGSPTSGTRRPAPASATPSSAPASPMPRRRGHASR
jgi:serine/threonine protein kinase